MKREEESASNADKVVDMGDVADELRKQNEHELTLLEPLRYAIGGFASFLLYISQMPSPCSNTSLQQAFQCGSACLERDSDMNRRRCSKRQPRPIIWRYGRVYLCSSLSGCSELRDGYREAMSVTFKLDTEDAQPIEIRGGQGILVRMEDGSLGVALVKAVRQVTILASGRNLTHRA